MILIILIEPIRNSDSSADSTLFCFVFPLVEVGDIVHPKEQLPIFLCNITKVYADYGKKNKLPKTNTGSELQVCEHKYSGK